MVANKSQKLRVMIVTPKRTRHFTLYFADNGQANRVMPPRGHGGSHPHMVHEFLSALANDRDPFPNAAQSANWTSVGILAHESAMRGGELIRLPEF